METPSVLLVFVLVRFSLIEKGGLKHFFRTTRLGAMLGSLTVLLPVLALISFTSSPYTGCFFAFLPKGLIFC